MASTPTAANLTESTALPALEASRGATGSRMRLRLITAGWGASGYYSPELLEAVASRGVFAAGTHMYLDHPTYTEAAERPERSVRDLAAVLTSPAVYRDGALEAEARVFGPFQQVLAETFEHIGVSIRASGLAEPGEVDGRTGPIVTDITEAISVDFVTRAGRGGEILALLESARGHAAATLQEARNVGAWVESRLHCQITQVADDMYGQGRLTREERIALSSAVGDALDAFVSRLEQEAPQLYQRDIWAEPEPAVDMAEANHNVPAPPVTTSTRRGAPMSGSTNPQGAPPDGGAPLETGELAEARRRTEELEQALTEARAQVEQLSNNAVRADRAERALAEARAEINRLRAAEAARRQVTEALGASGLPEVSWPRVTNVVVGRDGAAVPLAESGQVDSERLAQAITAAVDSERTYIAGLAEAAGTGVPRGLGGAPAGQEPLSESAFEASLAGLLTGSGIDETTAKLAAKGR